VGDIYIYISRYSYVCVCVHVTRLDVLQRPTACYQVLWADYRTDRYWWGFFDYFRRIALTGLLLLIPERLALLRLFSALLFTLTFILLQSMFNSHARRDVATLSMAEQAVTFVLLLGNSFIFLFERFAVFLPVEDDGTSAVSLVLVRHPDRYLIGLGLTLNPNTIEKQDGEQMPRVTGTRQEDPTHREPTQRGEGGQRLARGLTP